MRVPELDALIEECTAIEATLRAVPADAWARPGLGEWTVHELAVHLDRQLSRITDYLGQEPDPGAPVVDLAGYYRYDPAEIAPGVAERARSAARLTPPAETPDRFAETWRAALARADGFAPDHLLPSPLGTIALRDYLGTRIVEAVVHHIDLRRALDLSPAPTPTAGRMTTGVLERLLGGPRPRNLGRDRFILVATGRLSHDDPRFPVFR